MFIIFDGDNNIANFVSEGENEDFQIMRIEQDISKGIVMQFHVDSYQMIIEEPDMPDEWKNKLL